MVARKQQAKNVDYWTMGKRILNRVAALGSKAVGFARSPTGQFIYKQLAKNPEYGGTVRNVYNSAINANKVLQNTARFANNPSKFLGSQQVQTKKPVSIERTRKETPHADPNPWGASYKPTSNQRNEGNPFDSLQFGR